MRRGNRRGNTLLEVIAASVVIATALVPALRLMRDSLGVSRDVELCDMMTTLSASRLEQSLAEVCGNWNTNSLSGDYSAMGYGQLRYSVTRSDAGSDGGIPDRLMAVAVIVWHDANGNGALETNEKRVRCASKLAKSVSYEHEATGM